MRFCSWHFYAPARVLLPNHFRNPLKTGLLAVGPCRDYGAGEEALARLPGEHPDVVIMDTRP